MPEQTSLARGMFVICWLVAGCETGSNERKLQFACVCSSSINLCIVCCLHSRSLTCFEEVSLLSMPSNNRSVASGKETLRRSRGSQGEPGGARGSILSRTMAMTSLVSPQCATAVSLLVWYAPLASTSSITRSQQGSCVSC